MEAEKTMGFDQISLTWWRQMTDFHPSTASQGLSYVFIGMLIGSLSYKGVTSLR